MSERHRPTDAGRVVVVPGHVVVRRGDQPLPMFAGKSKLGASGDRRSTCTGPFPSRRAPPTPLTSHAWASSDPVTDGARFPSSGRQNHDSARTRGSQNPKKRCERAKRSPALRAELHLALLGTIRSIPL